MTEQDCPHCRDIIGDLHDQIAALEGQIERYDELLEEMANDGVDVAGYKEDCDIERRARR